ncbi:MAG: hypothetical protein GY941_30645 [Planctomycetes bacterium]|nr:hypothetical protein [Planctomycetota bacterium]
MREGFKSILELLQSNVEIEEEQEQFYRQCVMESADSRVRQLFNHLARASHGQKEAFKKIIMSIESEDHTVGLYCSVCGWAVDFGKSPSVGNEERCPLCCQKFALVETGDDFVLKPILQ